MKLKYRILRWLGVVSPSGAYPLPPRWAMSKLGKSRWYPDDQRQQELAYAADIVAGLHTKRTVIASGDRSVAAGGNIGTVNTWAADVVAGPIQPGALTRFTTGGRSDHVHGATSRGVCGPGSGYQVNCFDRQPYGGQTDGDTC